MDKLFKQLRLKASAQLDDRVHSDIARGLEKSTKTKSAVMQPNVWRIIMKSRMTKLAAAAVIIIAMVLSITFLDKAVTPAYALKQTIKASQDIHTLYFEYLSHPESKPIKECWIEFGPNGEPNNIRTNMHADWNIVHVWKSGQTTTWRKDENTLQVFNGGPTTEMMLRLVRNCDPKTALQSLYDRRAKGDVTIEIEEPSTKDKPIVVKATFLPGRYIPDKPTLPTFRDVFYVDQNTKLVTSIEVYELKNGVYVYNGVWTSFEYDELFEAGIFDLEDEVPPDVNRFTTIY
ncbi:MAG: hypothetical protein ACYSUC_08940 [Planctomycetota bacterium]